jgi:hypothetical protein
MENLPGTGIDEKFVDIEFAAIEEAYEDSLELIDLSEFSPMKYLIKIVNKKDRSFYFFKNNENKPWHTDNLDLAMDMAKQIRTWHPKAHVLVMKEENYGAIRI